MKSATLAHLFAAIILFAIAFATPDVALADVAAPAAPAEAPAAQDATATLVADLAIKYPVVFTVLTIVGMLRLLVKPVMAYLHARAAATETKEDDERLARVAQSWWMKALLFVLDWGASIKPVAK